MKTLFIITALNDLFSGFEFHGILRQWFCLRHTITKTGKLSVYKEDTYFSLRNLTDYNHK